VKWRIAGRKAAKAQLWRGGEHVPDYETTVYVGNLPWDTTEDDLAHLFSDFGPVVDARVIQDRVTGRSSGYGFVELSSREQAARACNALDGHVFKGRSLLVSPARPKPPRH
jgi:RNA recognition motif-containing protein